MAEDKQTKDLFVIFADLSGSTGLYSKVGDQKAHEMVDRALADLSDIIKENFGEVIKTIGDEILAVFEHGPSALEAIFHMQKILELSEAYTAVPGGFKIRVGIQQGSVIVENKDVFGNAVNTAARIVAMAKANQILTTQETLDCLGDDFRGLARKTDVVRLKGLKGEFTIFEILSPEGQQTVTMALDEDSVVGLTKSQQQLKLNFQDREIVLDRNNAQLSFGRGNGNDLVVASQMASRFHGKIEFKKDRFVLVDQSYNGTYVLPEGAELTQVRHDEFVLQGSGSIFLGHKNTADTLNAIRYHLD